MLLGRLLKNVMSAGKTRQNSTKKRSLCAINEHFEEDFNAVLLSAIVLQGLPTRIYHATEGFIGKALKGLAVVGLLQTLDNAANGCLSERPRGEIFFCFS
jgi:hypothetical protein